MSLPPFRAGAGHGREPRLRPRVTLAAALMLAALVAVMAIPQARLEPLQTLRYPAESAGRVSDRHLAFYEGYASVPDWERFLHGLLFGSRTEVENKAIEVYQEILAHFEAHPADSTPWAVQNTRSRLLVTLGETRPWPQLDQALSRLGDHPEQAALAAALRYAYAEPLPPAMTPEVVIGASLLPRGWAADRVRLRVAARSGNTAEAGYRAARLSTEGEQLRRRTLMLTVTVAILMLTGLGALILPGQLSPQPAAWRGGALDQPWPWSQGFGVAARAGLLGIAIVIGLQFMAGSYFRPGVLALWSSLFAALPMLWLMHRHLLRPRGLHFAQAFGLTLSGVRAASFARIVLAILTLEWAGSLLIAWLSWKLNLESHWSQGLHDRLLFGPWETTFFSAVDMVAWGPMVEEIAFRGLLYVTLRSRFKPLPAAAISAGAFSALHFYSLPGFLAVFWSGLVFALAFERFRSLLPVMAVHAASNALALSTVLLFYR